MSRKKNIERASERTSEFPELDKYLQLAAKLQQGLLEENIKLVLCGGLSSEFQKIFSISFK